jgi:hypothetical protein
MCCMTKPECAIRPGQATDPSRQVVRHGSGNFNAAFQDTFRFGVNQRPIAATQGEAGRIHRANRARRGRMADWIGHMGHILARAPPEIFAS